MSLKSYRHKRDFRRTHEPRGKTLSKRGDHSFVVQKHAARRLHYDFCLELNGVLLSWVLPKGPSLDPKEKRLPEGEYGAGTVLLWDRGRWIPDGDPSKGCWAMTSRSLTPSWWF
jgi:bifunctional non-homologous end joining protein LigD